MKQLETRRSLKPRARAGGSRPLVLGALLAAVLPLVPPPRRAYALSREDQIFADFLIRELRYFDTARRWLLKLRSDPSLDPACKAEIDSRLIDILQAEGKQEEALKALERFKREHPGHPRAALGSLEALAVAFGKVVEKLEKSAIESDKAEAERLLREAQAAFRTTVREPLEKLIADLRSQAEAAPEDLQRKRLRNQAELSRVKLFLNYAKLLPEDSPERKKVLEEGLALAREFVDERYEFYIMQFEAQIQKGLYLLELGRYDEAVEELSILYDIMPLSQPPYSEALITAIKTIRLQAVLFGARALNAAGRSAEAVELLERHYVRAPANDPFSLRGAENVPQLAVFAALAKLEYGVALAGAGRTREGLEIIHEVIRNAPQESLVVDARKALGRIASQAGAALSGRDYYEAGIGLKSEIKFEEALETFQMALATLTPEDTAEYAPLCLNEIGEISFILGRYLESAVAYEDLVAFFPEHELGCKAAKNFLAAVTKAQDLPGYGRHKGLERLRAEAQQGYDSLCGEGLAAYQAAMVDARRLEEQGNYEEARKKYLSVPREVEGEVVPFYWRAQASAWSVLVTRMWQPRDPEGRKELDPEIDKAIPELKKIYEGALADKQLDGAALAALTLGLIFYERGRHGEAVETLRSFLGPLSGDEVFRCPALGYLVLAATGVGDGETAQDAFRLLLKHCKDDPATASAAWALAEYYQAEEDYERAAVCMQIWAEHPSSKAELEKVETLMHVARVLVDGNMILEAQEYIRKAQEIAKAKGTGLDRELLLLAARADKAQKRWDQVIQKLEEYVKRFKADGSHFEDPYVRRDLARAYLYAGGKPVPAANLLKADQHYRWAIRILRPAIAKSPQARRLFWRWSYEWLLVKYQLGKAGEKDALRAILVFVDWGRDKDMGGEDLKQRFLRLEAAARRLLGESGGAQGGS